MRTKFKNKDLIGLHFGKLTIKEVIIGADSNRMVWCECDCGNFTRTRSSDVERGHTQSCGCLVGTVERRLKSEKIEATTAKNMNIVKHWRRDRNKFEVTDGNTVVGYYKEEWQADLAVQKSIELHQEMKL